MADLTGNDRAQMLLVTGFVLAASFVALALVLNSVIYTENLATRGEEASGSDAVTYRGDMVRGTGELIEYANHNNTTRSDIRGEYVTMMRSMRNQSARHRVVDARLVNTSIYAITWGTRIRQTQEDTFTSAGGTANWKLVNRTYGTRDFRANMTNSPLEETNVAPLRVQVEDADPTNNTYWEIALGLDPDITSATEVEIYLDGAKVGECKSSKLTPTVDLTAGTFDGQECPELVFGEGISPPYNVTIKNGGNAEGTYGLVVNSTDYRSTNYQNYPNTPFAVDAIYVSTIHVEYRTADLEYETDARVVPGESDE